MPGSIITVKGNVQKPGRVDVRHNGQIFGAIIRDIAARADAVYDNPGTFPSCQHNVFVPTMTLDYDAVRVQFYSPFAFLAMKSLSRRSLFVTYRWERWARLSKHMKTWTALVSC